MAEEPNLIIEQLNALSETVTRLRVEAQKRDWTSYVPIFTAALTFVIAIFSTVISYKINTLEQQQKETETRLSREQANASLSLSIVHELLSVIGEENENVKKRTAMANLLDSLDNLYREEAGQEQIRQFIVKLEALLQGPAAVFAQDNGTIPVRSGTDSGVGSSTVSAPSQAAPTKVIKQANGTLVSEGNPKGWDYDIFWCETQSKSHSAAQTIFDTLANRDNTSSGLGLLGRVRLRVLPEDVNQRPEYNIHKSVVIKRPPPCQVSDCAAWHVAKTKQAGIFEKWVNTVLSAQGIQAAEIEDSSFKLPWYLSLFVCIES